MPGSESRGAICCSAASNPPGWADDRSSAMEYPGAVVAIEQPPEIRLEVGQQQGWDAHGACEVGQGRVHGDHQIHAAQGIGRIRKGLQHWREPQ